MGQSPNELVSTTLPLMPTEMDEHLNDSLLRARPAATSRWTRLHESWVKLRRSSNGVILVVSLALFTDSVLYDVVVPVLPALVKKVGVDPRNVGFLFATYAIGILTFTPIFGTWSDRIKSRKIPMIAGHAGLTAATVLFALAGNYYVLISARFLQGVSAAATWPLGYALLADSFPSNTLGSASGKAASMSSLGYFVGPLLGGVISQVVSLEAPFYVCALLASLNLVLRLFIDPPKAARQRRAEPPARVSQEETLISIHSPTLTEPRSPPLGSYPPSPNLFAQLSSVHLCARTSISQPLPPIREEEDFSLFYLFSLQEIAVCGTVISLTAGSFAVVETLIANHLDHLFGFTPMGVAFMMMAYVLPCAVFSHLGGKWADRFDRYLIMCLTMACFSLTHVLLGYSTTVLTLVISSTLYSATWAAASAQAIPEMATVINRLGGDSYARVYAVSNIYYALGMLIGPIMAEYCDKLVGFAMTMVILSVLVAAALPLLAFAARKSIRKELHSQIINRSQMAS